MVLGLRLGGLSGNEAEHERRRYRECRSGIEKRRVIDRGRGSIERAEYYAVANPVGDLLGVQSVADDFGGVMNIKVFVDSASAQGIASRCDIGTAGACGSRISCDVVRCSSSRDVCYVDRDAVLLDEKKPGVDTPLVSPLIGCGRTPQLHMTPLGTLAYLKVLLRL